MPEYAVLDKDTIKKEIMPYLSVAKGGFASKFDLVEIVNAILFKLKSGRQWRMLPVGHLFIGVPPSWKSVFHHYRKWRKAGERKLVFAKLLNRNKRHMDLSLAHIDCSHAPVYHGGEKIDYHGIKKRNTTNSLFFSDRNGLPLAMSEPQSGNHADLFEIDKRVSEIAESIKSADINIDGLFCNLDAGFDGKELRLALERENVIANVCPDPINGGEPAEDCLFDNKCIRNAGLSKEPTHGWMASSLRLQDSTTQFPVGKGGTILRSSLFSLKKFTNQISLDNFRKINGICSIRRQN